MCRSAADGGRRCSGTSCGAASARLRQRACRARRGLAAACAAGDPADIAAAEAKYIAATGDTPPGPAAPTPPTPEKTMPTPEPTTPDRKPQPAKADTTEQRIRDVYKSLAEKEQDWIRLARIREALGDDVDQAEVTRVLTNMIRGGEVHLAPDSNRKVLTQADHDAAIPMGGEDKNLLCIEPPSIDGAADHVRDIGPTNATDEELTNALNAPECRSAFREEIRAEQRRRSK